MKSKWSEQKPRYEHDCSKCIFLGHYNKYDLYMCGAWEGEPEITDFVLNTVIARKSSEGSDYCSGTVFAFTGHDTPLRQAVARAIRHSWVRVDEPTLRYAWRHEIESKLIKECTFD